MPCSDQDLECYRDHLIQLERVVSESSLLSPVVVLGDFNAHLGSLGERKDRVTLMCKVFWWVRWWSNVTWVLCLFTVCPLAPALPTWAVMYEQQLTISLLMLRLPLWCQVVVFSLWMTSIPQLMFQFLAVIKSGLLLTSVWLWTHCLLTVNCCSHITAEIPQDDNRTE